MKILFYGAGVIGSLYAARNEIKQIDGEFKVLAIDMVAPTYGKHHLKDFFWENIGKV